MRKGLFCADVFLHLFVDPDVEAEHFVVLLQGELGLGIWSDVRSVIDGESLQTTLTGDGVVTRDRAVTII